MESEEEDIDTIQKRNTIHKLEITLKEQKEKFEKEELQKKNVPQKKTNEQKEKDYLRKSIYSKNPIIDKGKIEHKLTKIISNFIKKHEIKQYEKIPEYIEEKEDATRLVKQCKKFDKNNNNFLPIIVISNELYEGILEFIDKYIKYKDYNVNLTLKKKLIVPISKINNYNIFHNEKNNEEEYNSFVAETISSTIIHLYDENEIKEIKTKIGIASNEFKQDFSNSIQKWVAMVYDIISDYILFNLLEKPLYFLCPSCEMPILYKENKIENINIDNKIYQNENNINNEINNLNENKNQIINNNAQNLNNDMIKNKEKIIKKRNEKKEEKEKIFMGKIKNDDEEALKFKSLINIANTILDLINFDYSFEDKKDEKKIQSIANPPPRSNNTGNEKNEKNIIYYDENRHTNYELFEREISGAFAFISEQRVLNIVMDYLNSKTIIKNFIFIIDGKNCVKILEDLNNQNYLNSFASCCLLTTNKKYDYLSSKYTKEIKIFKTKKELIEYIKNYDNIGLINSIKLVNFKKYSDTYRKFHEKMALYYGTLGVQNLYSSSISLFKEFTGTTHNLVDEFKIFEEGVNKKKEIVQLYTNYSYYIQFNRWLYELDFTAYEKTSYFLSGIMYSLDLFGDEQKNQNREITLYRGMRLDIIGLLPYKNCEGKIIVFPGFTSTSINIETSKNFSDRNSSPEYRKNQKIYSCIFFIRFILKSNWFPNGIDVHNISCFGNEEEILFQPFTFFKITKVDINFDINIADINLEVIGRKEILEEKIKKGKIITYNINEGIMEVVE